MEIPIIQQPRCHTCRHPRRVWIERQMIEGVPFVVIAHILNRVEGRDIRTRSLSRHYEKHLAPVLARLEIRLELDQLLKAMHARASSGHDFPPPLAPALGSTVLARKK